MKANVRNRPSKGGLEERSDGNGGDPRLRKDFTKNLPDWPLVYRFKWVIRLELGFSALSVLLLLAFLMPYAKGGWIREAAVIILYFALLVALGAGATLTARSKQV